MIAESFNQTNIGICQIIIAQRQHDVAVHFHAIYIVVVDTNDWRQFYQKWSPKVNLKHHAHAMSVRKTCGDNLWVLSWQQTKFVRSNYVSMILLLYMYCFSGQTHERNCVSRQCYFIQSIEFLCIHDFCATCVRTGRTNGRCVVLFLVS